MTSKRQKARAALLEWKAKTTPEMFVEEHKGIIFATTDKSPRLEIATDLASMLTDLTDRFLTLWIKEEPSKARKSKSVDICSYHNHVISIPTNSFEAMVKSNTNTEHLTDVFETLSYQDHIHSASKDFSTKGYDEIFNCISKNPLRPV
ncbi:hypothetical protein NRA61_12935 [Acinetobacter baumannii]|nr:hypothetical protein [Acinetobacter baumannii]